MVVKNIDVRWRGDYEINGLALQRQIAGVLQIRLDLAVGIWQPTDQLGESCELALNKIARDSIVVYIQDADERVKQNFRPVAQQFPNADRPFFNVFNRQLVFRKDHYWELRVNSESQF